MRIMDWSNDLTLLLIELYRSKPCLWDPKDNNYRIKSVKNDAWKDISEILKCSLDEAKRKMESVLASFRRERQRELKAGAVGGYNSSWFAFQHMQFLMDKFQTTRVVDYDDCQVLEEDYEIENTHPLDEKSDLSILSDETLSTPSVSKDREKRRDCDIPQQALPQKKRYLQSARAASVPYKTSHDPASRRTRDESAVFGEYIATKLRHYSVYTKNVVQHLISNIVFEADMGKYNEPAQSEDSMLSPFVLTQINQFSPPCSPL